MRPSLRPVKKRLISAIKRSNSIKEVATRLNISERSAYRYIKSYGIDIRNYGFPPQHPHTPDTPELRNKIAITYLQEHAIIKVHRKLHVGRQRLSRILKQTGFAIFDSNVAKLIQRHFNGEHSLPYSKKLSAIITGELLGDGNLSCPANSKANQWSMPLKNYIDAIETPKRLAKELGSNTLSTTEAIQKYNFTAKKLVNAQIAHFRLHKSPLEEPWIRYVAKQFENDSYSVNFVPTNRSIHMTTQGTVQLYNQYRLWYPSSKKQVPKNLNLTPEIVLHWYVGDGSLGKNQALLHTQCFKKSGNEYLVDLLMNDTGIMAKIGSFIDPRTKKPCYQVHI
ncbi:MAG: hypothetical protein ACXAB4_09650, partial [Candidatus Hodarchaeales archaeon]